MNNNLQAVFTDIFNRGVWYKLRPEDEAAAIPLAAAGDDQALTSLLYAYAPSLRSALAPHKRSASAADLEDIQAQLVLGFCTTVRQAVEEGLDSLESRIVYGLRDALYDISYSTVMAVPTRTYRRFLAVLKEADNDVDRAAELAPSMGMTAKVFRSIYTLVRRPAGSGHVAASDEWAAAELIGVGQAPMTEDDVDDYLLAHAALDALRDNPQGLDITRRAHGFETHGDPRSDAAIAEDLTYERRLPDGTIEVHKTSRSTVRRVRLEALDQMREALGVS